MDGEEQKSIVNENRLNELNSISFDRWPKENLVEFINFFRANNFKEYNNVFESYEECLRGD